jgi:hypothetical protein
MQKPGWRTTEFWLSLVAALVGLFMASGVLPVEHMAMKIAGFALSALAALGYSVGRGIAKANIPQALAAINESEAGAPIKVPEWAEDKKPE